MNQTAMSINLKLGQHQHQATTADRSQAVPETETFLERINPLKHHLFNFIYKALNFSEDAQDVFQETILRAFKYLNTFSTKRGASFKTWLYTIAHNEIRNHYRQDKNRPEPLEDDSRVKIGSSPNNQARDIYEIAGRLGQKNRNVFFLFYYNQFSIREIKEITGLKEGNIKFILHQARSIIKNHLGVTDE